MTWSRNLFLVIFIITTLLFSSFGFTKASLDVENENINQQMNEILENINHTSTNSEYLNILMEKIKSLQTQVKSCIKKSKVKDKKIELLLKDPDVIENFKKDVDASQHLKNERSNIVEQAGFCKVLEYRLEEILLKVQDRIVHTSVSGLYDKHPNISNQFNQATTNNSTEIVRNMYIKSGLNHLHRSDIIGIVILVLLGFFLAYIFRIASEKYMAGINHHIVKLVQINFFILLPLILMIIYLNVSLRNLSPTPSILIIARALLVYSILIALIKMAITIAVEKKLWRSASTIRNVFAKFIFIVAFIGVIYGFFNRVVLDHAAIINTTRLLYLSYVISMIRICIGILYLSKDYEPQINDTFFKRVWVVISLILIGYIGHVVWSDHSDNTLMYYRYSNAYIFLMNLLLCWLIWPVFNVGYFKEKGHILIQKTAKIALKLCLILIAVMLWNGYRNLAMVFIVNLLVTAALLMILVDVSRSLGELYNLFSNPKYTYSQKLHLLLGLHHSSKLIELYVIRLIAIIPISIIILFCLTVLWGGRGEQIIIIMDDLESGVTIMGIKIVLPNIIRACVAFCFVALMGRILATYVSNRRLFSGDKHAQEAMRIVMNYLTFAIAVIVALIVAGISIAGIAVVAGALSVGLGFGLQHFASDFVSGLFLLINKPVKIGDHVMIELIDGYVKKIGLLSTQLTTLDQSDVIIPNSKLNMMAVTNFTFERNHQSRITIIVTLQNDVDPELAKELLLEVAAKNIDVVQKKPNQPTVLFQLNALKLFCFIADVNKKDQIISELNFAISKAFRENNLPL